MIFTMFTEAVIIKNFVSCEVKNLELQKNWPPTKWKKNMLEPFDNEYNEVLNMLKSINKEIKKNVIHRNVGLSNFVDISTEIYHLSTIIILWVSK